MTKNKDLFEHYAYHRICDDFEFDGTKKSLIPLCLLAKKDISQINNLSQEQAVSKLILDIPHRYQAKVALIERAMRNRYKIDADCKDENLMWQTYLNFKQILDILPNDSVKNTQTRIGIYDHMYSINEQLVPDNCNLRFEIVKKSVREIKNNDGRFDHNPLNIIARQVQYFMRSIPAQRRYALLLEIKRKTHDQSAYDYTLQIADLHDEYRKETLRNRYETREYNQDRYEQIRNKELPQASNDEDKIKLYNELLGLINSQDFSRGRKFNEKKSTYHKLSELYKNTGNIAAAQEAQAHYEKFANARKICREAARIKGYKFGKDY